MGWNALAIFRGFPAESAMIPSAIDWAIRSSCACASAGKERPVPERDAWARISDRLFAFPIVVPETLSETGREGRAVALESDAVGRDWETGEFWEFAPDEEVREDPREEPPPGPPPDECVETFVWEPPESDQPDEPPPDEPELPPEEPPPDGDAEDVTVTKQ